MFFWQMRWPEIFLSCETEFYQTKHWVLVLGSMAVVLGDAVRQPAPAPASTPPRAHAGWLDRAVHFHRQRFVDDVRRVGVVPVQIQASLERAPAGYQDSAAWNYTSVVRLLALLRGSEAAAPVRRALRPYINTRRFIPSKQQSWNLFPSLGKKHLNEIYYDFNSYSESETDAPSEAWSEQDVVVLRNPVEARLPGARISLKLLRQILEERAEAARAMPSTARSTIPWIPMNKTSAASAANKPQPEVNATIESDGQQTTASGGAGGSGADGTEVSAPGAGGEGGAGGTDTGASDAPAVTDGGGDGTTEAEPSADPQRALSARRPKYTFRGADLPEDTKPGLRTSAKLGLHNI